MDKIILKKSEKPKVEKRRTVNIKPTNYNRLQEINELTNIPIETLVNDWISLCLDNVVIED